MVESRSRVKVRYCETDQAGVVHHTHYFTYFEVGRTDFFRQIGFDYGAEVEAHGLVAVVTQAVCRYIKPARYDDDLVVRTCVDSLNGPKVTFAYRVEREGDGALIAVGSTTHAFVDRQGKVRTAADDPYVAAIFGGLAAAVEPNDAGF